MKKQLLLVAIIAFTHLISQAQSGVPQAMKYQSVARNKYGLEIKNTKIYLQISLGTKKFDARKDDSTITVYYLEQHAVETNSLGLFSLSIGEGIVKKGKFDSIPWYTDDIWMNIDFREKEYQPFALISSSRLLTVPYAFHALSATHVTGIADGALANIWGLKGNTNINPETDFLGTKDNNDLKFITNNKVRLKIDSTGKVKMDGALKVEDSLEIGGNLIAKDSVFLNTMKGATYVNGNTTFKQKVLLSSTEPSKDPTSGTLVVKGGAGIGGSLNVGSAMTVGDTVAFKSNAQTYNSKTGALVVNGGVGIGKDLNIGGSMKATNAAAINSSTNSGSATTGALVVAGGAGIGKDVNIGGSLAVKTNTSTKSLLVSESAQIDKNASIGGTLDVTGGTNLNGEFNVTNGNEYVANFTNTDYKKNGINIKINTAVPNNNNNFITFQNNNGDVVGRIEGQTIVDLTNDPEYVNDIYLFDLDIGTASLDLVTAVMYEASAVATLVGSTVSSTICAGLGACVTAPIPSLVAAAITNVAAATIDLVKVSINQAKVVESKKIYENLKRDNIGVTYQSGSGDYAEWLPKANPNEKFRSGYIIGIKNGQISLRTADADKILAISTKPIVLGNMPEQGKEKDYEQVAFLGQVPIHVVGKVNMGDYIVPSGHNNGFGKAIAPINMTPSDFEKVLGMAWSSSQNDVYNVINVAIGLNAGDISKVVAKQEQEIKELKTKQEQEIKELKTTIDDIKLVLARLEAGSKAPTAPKVNPAMERTSLPSNTVATNGPTKWATGTKADGSRFQAEVPDASRILYYDITDAQMEEGFNLAMEQMKQRGLDVDTNPFLKKLLTDPSYKKMIMATMKENIAKQLKLQQHIDNPNNPIK